MEKSSQEIEEARNNSNNLITNFDHKINLLFALLSDYDEKEIYAYLNKRKEKTTEGYSSLFLNENDLKNWFIRNFEEWFDVYPDIEGVTTKYGKEIKIVADFIIHPKTEFNVTGIHGFLGIEVKHITDKSFFEKSAKTVFQTISYAYSDVTWNVKKINQQIKTEAFLTFTNLSFKTEKEKLLDDKCRRYWNAMMAVANHADVGELIVNNSMKNMKSWYMYFSGGNYCSWNRNKGLILNNKNVIGKKKIGNIC